MEIPEQADRYAKRAWIRWQAIRRNPRYIWEFEQSLEWLKENDEYHYRWVLQMNGKPQPPSPYVDENHEYIPYWSEYEFYPEMTPTACMMESFKSKWGLFCPVFPSLDWNIEERIPGVLLHLDVNEYWLDGAITCEEYDAMNSEISNAFFEYKTLEEKQKAVNLMREGRYNKLIKRNIYPHTKITLKVNLRVPVKVLLDRIGTIIEKMQTIMKSYDIKIQDIRTRFEEAQKAFKIWDLRREERLTYQQIVDREFPGESLQWVHANFAKAYELIHGKPYQRRDPREVQPKLRDQQELCPSCPKHPDHGGDCQEPCPELIAHLEQLEGPQREQLFDPQKLDTLGHGNQ
ncbi:MAG: hypothetical protein HYY96_13565 [Candidatus Tectomicrobia bacterium]|nr:hypothetical protein [Candidatus Tectomicrobia bacterium]